MMKAMCRVLMCIYIYLVASYVMSHHLASPGFSHYRSLYSYMNLDVIYIHTDCMIKVCVKCKMNNQNE